MLRKTAGEGHRGRDGWMASLIRHEFEQAPGDGKEQRNLACCSPWGHKKSDMTWWLNNNKPGQGASQVTLVVKNPWFCSLGREDPLKEGVATHSSLLAWKSSWTEEPGGLQSMGSHRVGHDWSDLASMRANWNRILRSVCCKFCRHLCIAKVRKVLMWEASWSNRAYEGQK